MRVPHLPALAALPLLGIAMLGLAACKPGKSDSAPVTSATAVAAAPAPAGKSWLDVVEKTELGYRQGNPDAPIKLVEYGSRSCPVCGAFANTGVEPLRANYVATGKVSYEYREYWVHPQDPGLTLLGNCVSTEAFFPILDQMYALQAEFNAKVTQDLYAQIQQLPKEQQPAAWAVQLGYVDFMKQRGVPEDKARQCLTDKSALSMFEDRVGKAHAEKDVSGTPTFFINDSQAPENTVSWDQLEPLLKAAGAR